jgi:DNA-binding response OmpR family regulator
MKKILIIEDDPVAGHVYRTRLQKEGYEVQIAVDAENALACLDTFRPDGLLLDLMLPKTSGIDLLKMIRQQGLNLPVIVFTNAFVPGMIEGARQAGATLVLDKMTMTPKALADAFRGSLPAAA